MTTQPTPETRRADYTYELGTTLEPNSYSVRENLADIIERELLGPGRGEEERLPFSPRSHYLVGMIAPVKIDEAASDSSTANADETTDSARDKDSSREPLIGENIPTTAEDLKQSGGLSSASAEDTTEAEEDDDEDRVPKQGSMLPSSMGLRFQIPAEQTTVTVTASWGTYRAVPTGEKDSKGRELRDYQRTPHEHRLPLTIAELTPGTTAEYILEDSIVLRVDRYNDVSRNRVLLEIALCNDEHAILPIPTEKWLYQTKLHIDAGGDAVFLPVRDVLTDTTPENDPELALLNLQYRNRLEFAIGRSCSANWLLAPGARTATAVETTWLPVSETPQTEARSVEGVMLSMKELSQASPEAISAGLQPLAEAYRSWLTSQEEIAASLPLHLQDTAHEAIEDAQDVLQRLEDGIAYLAQNEQAQKAFAFMNRVMKDQRLRSQVAAERSSDENLSISDAETLVEARGEKAASWRVFQLAFILLQLKALTEPESQQRSGEFARAELLFFPTGGGKTEAYLGLAAYTFAIRRLQGTVESADGTLNGNDGVSVLMRYTLRLLTSQQFQRASTLMCAAELVRQEDPATWGETPFRIGLWVGSAVSPKHFQEAKEQVTEARSRDFKGNHLTVLQVQRCPWCGTKISANNIETDDVARRVFIYCGDDRGRCPFANGSTVKEGLPIVTTDEEIYALTPAFVIATVDKFARLAREGQAASLFGYVRQYCPRHGYQHEDSYERCTGASHNKKGNHGKVSVVNVGRLRPPDLIIQDELHLITGALGTAVGLFETTVEVLCSWEKPDGTSVLPMIVASTATVRNAKNQIRELYGRRTNIFPPQVLDVADTFFSREKKVDSQNPGRRYLGISAQGVRLSSAEIRIAEVLLTSSKLLYNRSEVDHPGGNYADAYMSLVCYFNATRELAGMSRYMAGDIYSRVTKPRSGSGFPRRYGSAGGGQLNIGELTSRISSTAIGRTLDELALEFEPSYDTSVAAESRRNLREKKKPVPKRKNQPPFDVVLATSMLQVGVDVQRLGLMLMVGQPKNTAEYIQASSRVGRDASRPGLVVSLHNWARPRDLAHFEQFRHYHETFYAQVEALSVTPFSPTSIERGLSGLFISAVRVLEAAEKDGLSPEKSAGRINERKEAVEKITQKLLARVQRTSSTSDVLESVQAQLVNRIETWDRRKNKARDFQQTLVYEKVGGEKKMALLRSPENSSSQATTNDLRAPFSVANSMREVQPEINLLVSPMKNRLFFSAENAPAWNVPAKEITND